MNNNDFTLTSFLVLTGILITGVALIHYFNAKEMRRLKREQQNRYPSATRKSGKVDRLLELDEYEQSISN